MIIQDGTGSGRAATINTENKLETNSVTSTVQHFISHQHGRAFQVIGTSIPAAGPVTVLHLKNTDTVRDFNITFIRMQLVDLTGGTALPNGSNFFTVALGRTATAGAAATPVNVNAGSTRIAGMEATDTAPTMAGTPKEIDRWYPQSIGAEQTFAKQGAVILTANSTIEVTFIGDYTAGTLYTRISGFYQEKD